MRVLFVSGGNSKTGISQLVRAQGESLARMGVDVDHYPVIGKGVKGYLANIPPLRKKLRESSYDLVHAHFSFCGFVAALAGAKPLVVSLMGWNVRKPLLRLAIKAFNRLFWQACVVKSEGMRKSLGIRGVVLLPNGVDLELFRPLNRQEARNRLGWKAGSRHILFAANPERPIKNFPLAKRSVELLDPGIEAELHVLQGVNHSEMPYHYNAADVVLLTSRAEGSPNVIKEAMACDCLIVSTDVGDVRERFSGNAACFISSQDACDIRDKLEQALGYNAPVKTRQAVLGLDSRQTAGTLLALYERVIS